MKKIIYVIIFAIVISFMNWSCRNQENVSPANKVLVETLKTDVGVVNGTLAFKTVDTYENYLKKLNSAPETISESEFLSKLESELGFQSKRNSLVNPTPLASGRTLSDEGIYDEHLASILNKDNMVWIDKWIFKLDLVNKKCYVLEAKDQELLEELKKNTPNHSKIQVFSTDDDVLDILQGVSSPSGRVQLFCREGGQGEQKDDAFVPFGSGGTYRLDCKVVYQKAAIYFSLQAKVKVQYNDGLIWWAYPDYPYLTGFNQHKPKCRDDSGVQNFYIGSAQANNELNRRPYESSRALAKFHYRVEFGIAQTMRTRAFVIKAGY